MTAAGVAKLIEEVGELQAELGQLVQVLGKKLAYWDADDHWDGSNLRERLQDEMGDVRAALDFVEERLRLDHEVIQARRRKKAALFDAWQEQIDNNDHGIDAPRATGRFDVA